jgi:UPF0755 protein
MRRLLLAACCLALVRLVWVNEVQAPVRSAAEPPQVLLVEPGSSSGAIGSQLEAMGLVRHRWVFRAYVASRGAGSRLRAGQYTLDGPLSLQQIVDLLVRGAADRHDVTFPEGRNYEELAAIAAQDGIAPEEFLAAARDPSPILDLDPAAPDLEGYLFPDTYDLPRGDDAAKVLVSRMVRRFRDVIRERMARLEERRLGLRELVTLASIVELETARADERPRIAAVFLNRLARGMPLQTDPTIIYAMRKAGRWNGNIRRRDLDIDSPYNTYRHTGLPPGPIGSPGEAALDAVLSPAEVDDLYFVSRNDGTHHFSRSLREHERAVDRYQRRRRSGSRDAS